MKIADTGPRAFGRNTSDKEPGATARLDDQEKPDINRKKSNSPKLREKPAPIVNAEPRIIEPRYTGYRPMVSESGPPRTGPNPSAKTYSVTVRMAAVLLTWNSCINSVRAGVTIELDMDLEDEELANRTDITGGRRTR